MTTHQLAAVAAAVLLGAVSALQLALASGAPLGAAAWGGTHRILPVKLRIGSGASAVILAAAASLVLGRAGFWGADLPPPIFRFGIWILFGFLCLNTLGNLASKSPVERWLMGGTTLLLAALCWIVARAPV